MTENQSRGLAEARASVAEPVDGWYFEVKRGSYAKQKDGRFAHFPASGLAYAGGLTQEQVDQLDWIVRDFMDSIGRSSFTEYGKQQHEAKRAMYAPVAAEGRAEPGMRLDAERYRWLRDKSVPPHNFYISVPIEFKDERFTPQQVDAAIDAAIAAAKGRAL